MPKQGGNRKRNESFFTRSVNSVFAFVRFAEFEILFVLFFLVAFIIFKDLVHIVYMGERRHDETELITDSHHEILSDILGSREAAMESILYSYKHGFSGFVAVLTPHQAALTADFPGVVHVVPNRILSLQTTRSWDFLQVRPHVVNGILSRSQSGVGCIIGVMDTGWYGNVVDVCWFWVFGSIMVFIIILQEFGLNPKALQMWGWERFRIIGEGYARKEKNSIVPIVIGWTFQGDNLEMKFINFNSTPVI